MRFLNEEELQQFGKIGKNVLIDSTVQFVKPENVEFGDHVRIDSFSFVSATNGVQFGDFIHLAPYVQLVSAGGKITLANFTALAARTSIFTASDDFIDGYMNNPTMPMELRKVKAGPVTLHKFAVTGCGSVILPGVTMHEGSGCGALSLISKDVDPFTLMGGCPAKKIAMRNKENLHLQEKKLHDMLSILP